jgi:long-chain fatty acid transport protein
MKTIKISAILSASALIFISQNTAHAAGFFLQEQSVSGLGSAFAGQAATARDSSVVFFNPAGMTQLDSATLNAGTHIIAPRSKMSNDGSTIDSNPGGGVTIVSLTGNDGGNPYTPTPIPNMHVAYPLLDKRLWVGFSSTAPFGLANKYDSGWFGRYDSTTTELEVLDFSPNVAYALTDWLSIGGGLNIQYAQAELGAVISATTEGESNLEGEDWSSGYNIGFLMEPVDGTNIGVHYRSEVEHKLNGRVSVVGSGSSLVNQNQPGNVNLTLPDILQLAVDQRINDKFKLLGGATWFGWSNFDAITVLDDSGTVISDTKQNYQNTWAFAIGGEYDLNEKWTLRAGYQFDATPTTDEFRTSRTPDGDRNWISTGATYKFNDKISIDMALTYIDIANETIDVDRNISTAVANVKAKTEGQIGIVAMGLNYKF